MIELLLALATWRVSHMIVKETGPLAVFSKFRAHLARKQGRVGGLFDMVSCVACTSVYVGAVAALVPAEGLFSWIMYTLAFSAVATFLEQLYGKLKTLDKLEAEIHYLRRSIELKEKDLEKTREMLAQRLAQLALEWGETEQEWLGN